MPYSSTSELPPAVRRKLKGKKRRQFMHVWNSSYANHGDESRAFAEAWATAQKGVTSMSDFNFYLPITKIDKDRRTVSGYASTPTLDLDGEIVSLDAVKKALPGYWEWRNIREMHTHSAVGVAKEANVDGTGLFLTAKIVDNDAWQKCLEQVYKGFSIGGKKLAKQGNTITEIDLVEISVVDRPANPDCRFEVNKRAAHRPPGAAELGYLVKSRTPEEKLLRKISKAMDLLAKRGIPPSPASAKPMPAKPSPVSMNPPAARDGFSLPGKVKKSKKCAIHGIKNCPTCVGKSKTQLTPIENNPFERKKKVKKFDSGVAMSDDSFRQSLDDARQEVRKAKNPTSARAYIRSRAAALGVKLPDNWTKKQAKLMIKLAELEKYSLPGEYMTLGEADRGPDLDLRKSVKPKSTIATDDTELTLGVESMDNSNVNLDQVLDALIKRGKVVTKAQHLAIARSNVKKARKARTDAIECIKSAHSMHKTAYLSKAGKASKPKPSDDDADDFDHTGAMEKLGKAYQSLDAMKTFMKAVSVHLKKAASRSGQRGEEVGDAKAPWYTVPPGIHDMGPSDLATAGPGGDNHGSTPAILTLEDRYPGKAAKKAPGSAVITQEHAQALIRAAAAEAEANLLKSMPATNGRRPVAFDVSKLANGNSDSDTAAASLMNGVDTAGLASDDENARKLAVGKLVGNMIIGGHGRSVFDPSFHGSAGG